MSEETETYLGDGLYVSVNYGMLRLRAPRGDHDDLVYMEPEVLKAFLEYAEQFRKYFR